MRLPILYALALSAAALSPVPLAAQAAPAGNPVRGGQLFLQCRACHSVAPEGTNAVGPNLVGVVGSNAAAKPGYTYSPAMAKSGIVWTPAKLDTFLTRPNALVPGTRMAFAGIANPQSRADVIAYLATLKKK